MSEPTERDIARRVYELWKLAGFPEGRDKEFEERAKQELQEEEKSGPPKTRDTPP
ncbi:DUF2934 domain-containing protein [Nitrobacter sp. TKz-YC02]|uniref:DUF2934 domain-containing protein n=1 Tax=Nitrobacter sp. TKz-YC02 TaxID=3398704 RepID=UPI003CF0FDDE